MFGVTTNEGVGKKYRFAIKMLSNNTIVYEDDVEHDSHDEAINAGLKLLSEFFTTAFADYAEHRRVRERWRQEEEQFLKDEAEQQAQRREELKAATQFQEQAATLAEAIVSALNRAGLVIQAVNTEEPPEERITETDIVEDDGMGSEI